MDTTLLKSLVAQAILAPNSHNTQPWRFTIVGGTIELRADRSRALPVADPQNRSLFISCGAALGTLRAAIAASGRLSDVMRLPDPNDPDLLARVTLADFFDPSDLDRARGEAITKRRTNRGPFQTWEVPPVVLRHMSATARREGVWMRAFTDAPDKHQVASLVAEGDRIQGHDPEFRREVASWMHNNISTARDGIPAGSYGIGDVMSMPFPWIIRTFDWGNGQAAKDLELADGSPVIAVLGSQKDDVADWLRTGEALALVLLDLTAAGLSASFLNQPVEVAELRPRLQHTLGLPGLPQLVLRIGYGRAVPATPRRVLDDVLVYT